MIINSHQNYSYMPLSRRVNFGQYSSYELKKIRLEAGLPEYISSAYNGYTGSKNYNFPTNPNLNIENYHDVEPDLEKLKNEIMGEIKKELNFPKVLKLFAKKFPTGEPWDTKYLPEFPGRDKKGHTQYALYKGEVVSANYISNNIYGQVCASIGLPLKLARLAAKIDACGLSDPVTKLKIPKMESLKFRDPVEDQNAIISGYNDYLYDSPWKNTKKYNLDPKQPYPKQELQKALIA